MQAIRTLLVLALALLPALARAENIQRIDADATGQAVAVDASGSVAYVADANGGFVTSVDALGHTARFPTGPNPRWIANDGDVYTSNAGDGTVTIIGAGFQAPVNVAVGGAGPIVASQPYGGTPNQGKAYLARQEKRDLAVVDAATRTSHPIDAGGRVTTALEADWGAHRLYAAQSDAGIVRVIDISADSPTPPATDVAVPGHPAYIAFDAGSRKTYALTGDAGTPLVEIDAGTLQVRPVSLAGHAGTPRSIAAGRGSVYVGFANEFVILERTTGNVRAYPMNGVVRVRSDSLSGNAYALDASGQLLADNDFTQRITLTALPAPAYDMAFIYKHSMPTGRSTTPSAASRRPRRSPGRSMVEIPRAASSRRAQRFQTSSL